MAGNGEFTLIEKVRNIVTTYKGTAGDGMSIADITKIARVQPITLISSSLAGTKELWDVLHGVLNIYSAYHLQAVSLLNTQLKDARILKILDKTNPDRDLKTFLAAGQLVYESERIMPSYVSPSMAVKTMALENCKYRLPMLPTKVFSAESAKLDGFGYSDDNGSDKKSYLHAAGLQVESFEKLGLTVGKVIDVDFSSDGKDGFTIPVVVKLDTMIIPGDTIVHLSTIDAAEVTMSSRMSDVMSGKISFIKDYLLCSDLIKQQKKAMIKDSTGLYSQLLKRINNSKIYSVLSGNVSLAAISAIYVMSEEEESEIQKKIGGKLTNQKTREMVFNNTSAMMLVVIDRGWERVSIYIRDIDGYSQAPLSSFKRMSDKGNDNLGDILKAFAMNTAPTF